MRGRAMNMQLLSSRRQHINTASMCFTLLMCFLILTLSGCSSLGTDTSSVSLTPTKQTTPFATVFPATPKLDSNGINTEAVSRYDLAKVQSIMANMSLDQKLGQLIVVEYLGHNYQDGLQYMISQQFVGGFMYQESNHNFEAPYNVASQVDALSQQAMQDAHIPLLIATDQEGGLVNRLYRFHGYLPSAADMAATGNPQVPLA